MKEIKEFKNILINQISFDIIDHETSTNSDIDDIVADIKEKGLIRPVIVYSTEPNKYNLLLGHKRLLATQQINQDSILCGVIEGKVTREESVAIALCYTTLEEMLSTSDKLAAINYLNKATKENIGKITAITNLSTDEINSYLNLPSELKVAKNLISKISNLKAEYKLGSLSPENITNLNKILNKLLNSNSKN
tara:strand:- start:110 stop:688 length:579 start_codon:yes stop_codon:yes gene_type:complete